MAFFGDPSRERFNPVHFSSFSSNPAALRSFPTRLVDGRVAGVAPAKLHVPPPGCSAGGRVRGEQGATGGGLAAQFFGHVFLSGLRPHGSFLGPDL